MKRFIKYSLFGFLFIILFGCANEVRVVSFNVEQHRDYHYWGITDFTPSNYFYVSALDSSGAENEIQCVGSYIEGETKMAGGYYYMETIGGRADQLGPWKIRLRYYPGGRVYNYGQLFTKEVTINVIAPNVLNVKLEMDSRSVYLQGFTWGQNSNPIYGLNTVMGTVTVNYPDGKFKLPIYSSCLTVTGVDEKSTEGAYLVSVTYCGVTSNQVRLSVVNRVVTYTESTITYYDHSTDLHLSPSTYTSIEEVDLPVYKKQGYDFLGWCTTVDNSGDADGNPIKKISYGISGNLKLYPKMTLSNYKIVYSDKKKATNKNPTSYTIKDKVELKDLTADGFTFDGWYEVVNDITSDTSTDGWNAGDRTGDVTLYAKWTIK